MLGIGLLVGMLAVIGTVISPTNSVGAATIQCGATFCPGTEASDTMIEDSDENVMGADNGDDIMSGKDAGDTMAGADGNDVMSGGNGDDRMAGSLRSDRITGGQGSDEIFHGISEEGTNPDGGKDAIDCGSGNDEAWINVSVDHDIVTNCEIVHSG